MNIAPARGDQLVGGAAQPLRILVAEDDLLSQEVILRLLHHLGHCPELVSDGLAAVEAIERQHYDVVLMDINMSPMDGRTACLEIRTRIASERRPRIYFLSASGKPTDRNSSIETIVSGWLSKPVALKQLREVLGGVEAASPPENVRDPKPTDHPWSLPGFFTEAGCDEETIGKLLAEFLRSAGKLIAEVRLNVHDGGNRSIIRAAHSLKGASRQMGAGRLASLAEQMESMGRQQRFIDAELIDSAEQELLLAERSIEAYLIRATIRHSH